MNDRLLVKGEVRYIRAFQSHDAANSLATPTCRFPLLADGIRHRDSLAIAKRIDGTDRFSADSIADASSDNAAIRPACAGFHHRVHETVRRPRLLFSAALRSPYPERRDRAGATNSSIRSATSSAAARACPRASDS